MVSTEQLRRYGFFAGCTADQLAAIGAISDEVDYATDTVVFTPGKPADALFILTDGAMDLHYTGTDPASGAVLTDFYISDINVGEPFGISALIAPHVYVGRIHASRPSKAIKVRGPELRELCKNDVRLDAVLAHRLLEATMSRLHDTRVLLAASSG